MVSNESLNFVLSESVNCLVIFKEKIAKISGNHVNF